MDDIPPANTYGDIRFDAQGNYCGVYASTHQFDVDVGLPTSSIPQDEYDDYIQECIDACQRVIVTRMDWKAHPPDPEHLCPYLCWQPRDVVQHTIENTTQWGCHVPHDTYWKSYKSQFPANNVRRRNEPVATDTFYSDTPAVDDGSVCAKLYTGLDSLYASVYGMKSTKEFVHTLCDTIRRHGAMDKLISDRAEVETSNKVLDILCTYFIGDWQSTPHY